ncbi:DUF4124 domain-containing protein [Marinobacter sp. NP-4(2019)]|uniref:DUF4124 domain-containing protein n=1 Tax=Marinobacter sp. NP-4(2019) TaxID=2488665 RepID=UPI000FC3EBF2|nr:DUF4124 domain-containing protein [Marinobacter sp. NP-4(2019)]AZT85450.1 DUF4124 domain-containing protein [Marinobacter sp. NP-4(2019)]
MLIRTLLTLLLLSPTASLAEVYRWTDSEGRTHFGDRPPTQAASQEVQVESAPARVDNAARDRQQKMNAFLEQKQQERDQQRAADAKAEKQAAKRAELCTKLRARLKYMDSVSTFYNLNEEGERVFVSESENTRIRERFRKKVEETCSS